MAETLEEKHCSIWMVDPKPHLDLGVLRMHHLMVISDERARVWVVQLEVV